MASKAGKYIEQPTRDNEIIGRPIKRASVQVSFKKKQAVNGKCNTLPVDDCREKFTSLFKLNQTIVIVGETGSGKTTQIPQWCMKDCLSKTERLCVACTQPRRIAAMSVAARVADEMNVVLGQEVGYAVRFENCTSKATKLKYLTDGMLLREAMLDSLLSSYGVIILDEAHERTLQTEILFGVVKRALTIRNEAGSTLSPLKVIIMSATINVKLFKKYFGSPVLTIEGRQYPVNDMFVEVPQSDLIMSTLITVFQIHRTCEEGDILVFCAGQDEILSLVTLCKKILKQAPESLRNLNPLPLYASLPAAHQMRVFFPCKSGQTDEVGNGFKPSQKIVTRRVIFATNVAETSITIPNIKFVIDTGKVKCRTYCPKTGLESLKVKSISKAQASQRSGRAGRIAPGTCFRLYTNDDYTSMADHQTPEINRCNMDSVTLQIISIGIRNISLFPFLEKPDESRITAALSSLLALKAIKASKDKISNPKTETNSVTYTNSPNNLSSRINGDNILTRSYDLTSIGEKLCAFPLIPSMSRILLAADELNCLDEALTVVSLLYVENVFHIPPNKQNQADLMLEKFRTNEGDIVMLLKVFKAFKRISLLNRSGLKIWCTEHFIHAKNLRLARLIRKQLQELCKSMGMSSSSCGQNTSILRRALTYGLFNNVATLWNGKYRNKSSSDLHIHPNSCLFKAKPECVLYVEIIETNKCYMRNCTLIDMSWIREISSANIDNANGRRSLPRT